MYGSRRLTLVQKPYCRRDFATAQHHVEPAERFLKLVGIVCVATLVFESVIGHVILVMPQLALASRPV